MKILINIIFITLFISCGGDSKKKNKSSTSPDSSAGASSNEQTLKIQKNHIDTTEDEVIHFSTYTPQTTIAPSGWFLTFEDNFDDAQTAIQNGADPSCFSRNPYCMLNWWHAEECPEFKDELANLNKCNWAAYNYYNYMDFDLPEGQGINSFHPTMIKVQNGKLYLNAEKSFYSEINCKTKFKDPRIGNFDNYTIQCPFISGAVESRPNAGGNFPGYVQEFGRFEVRAKLNNGPGAWPAHWLLPQHLDEEGCGWPHNGEIDIMESWINSDERVSGTLHSGNCEKDIKLSKGFNWKAKSEFYPELSIGQRKNTFHQNFHTYAVEWDQQKIRFLVDDHFIGQVNHGDIIKNKNTPSGGLPIEVPKGPFYWILNTTIYKDADNTPDPNGFTKQEHIIDYVRAYRKCVAGDDPSKCVQPTYKNTDPLCPGIREYLGDYNNKSKCKAWPHFKISYAKCLAKDGTIDSANNLCLLDEGTWYKAREIGEACSWPRDHVGWYTEKPVCKAWPHFKIKESNCDGSKWNGFCIWPRDGWWRARELK